MTWIGGVKRYWPVLARFLPIDRGGSSTSVVALPLVFGKGPPRGRSRTRAPELPSMHLFGGGGDGIAAWSWRHPTARHRMRSWHRSAAGAPVLSSTSAPISAMGFRMPLVVLAMHGEHVRDALIGLQGRYRLQTRSGGVSLRRLVHLDPCARRSGQIRFARWAIGRR